MVIHSLLRSKAKFAGEDALFWPVLDEVEKLFHERELVQVDVAPADLLRPIATDLLFKLNLPKIGEQAFVETTPILGKSACDAARRQAESMKKRKADLSAELVLARLKRESTGKSKQLERMHV